jgi:hypothetical protein
VSPRARYVHQAVTSGASLCIFLETKYKLTVVYMHMTKWAMDLPCVALMLLKDQCHGKNCFDKTLNKTIKNIVCFFFWGGGTPFMSMAGWGWCNDGGGVPLNFLDIFNKTSFWLPPGRAPHSGLSLDIIIFFSSYISISIYLMTFLSKKIFWSPNGENWSMEKFENFKPNTFANFEVPAKIAHRNFFLLFRA